MAPSALADVAQPNESPLPAVNWAPIVAGAFAASTLTFVLMLVGSGLGLTLVSPWAGQNASATTFAVSGAVWLIIVQWLSSGLGGYLTGRLRTRWVGIHTDETFFRDTVHGFLAWALATMLVVFVLGSATSAAVGTGVRAASTVASGAAMGATAGSENDSARAMTSYFVDALFRPSDVSRLPPPTEGRDEAVAGQVSRILAMSATVGAITPDDKAYLVQLVAARTGLPEQDATSRVDAVLARVEQAKTDAKEAADTARKAAATFALFGALSLVIGAFIASAAAALGGRQRDDWEQPS